ncbi:DUF5133 domain-containing protein [Streptomyces sp. NPDC050738]|uniref:DUF5133 domain-containing protein n=1 Tax=Streptomyces sp. NPDC050738 TaxID=3154744 RepID=UPI00341ABD7A
MLIPSTEDLRAALAQYADAVITDERCSTPESARRRENTAYTLCVLTGTSEPDRAIAAADALLLHRQSGGVTEEGSAQTELRPSPPQPGGLATAADPSAAVTEAA